MEGKTCGYSNDVESCDESTLTIQDSNITLFVLLFFLCVLRVLCGWRLLIARQATAAGKATPSFSLQGCSDGRMLG